MASIPERWRQFRSGRIARPAAVSLRLEQLDERILYSADFSPLQAGDDGLIDFPAPLVSVVRQEALELQSPSVPTIAVGRELILVDGAIDDAESLVEEIRSNAGDDRHFDVLLIESDRDGYAQIEQFIAGRPAWQAWHLISHGAAGVVSIGGSILDTAAVAERADELSAWGRAIAEDGGRNADRCAHLAKHRSAPDPHTH